MSNLSLISKIIERVVKSRLTDHLYSHNLLNPHQSAYHRHHSTETSLLYVHDHLITATGSQKLSCLCLLDLSAAFDTTDHDILLTRLSSWFNIHSSVLNLFKYYLLSRTFCVKCNDCFSSLHTSLYGIPQSSILGPLLFIMYTPLRRHFVALTLLILPNANWKQFYLPRPFSFLIFIFCILLGAPVVFRALMSP